MWGCSQVHQGWAVPQGSRNGPSERIVVQMPAGPPGDAHTAHHRYAFEPHAVKGRCLAVRGTRQMWRAHGDNTVQAQPWVSCTVGNQPFLHLGCQPGGRGGAPRSAELVPFTRGCGGRRRGAYGSSLTAPPAPPCCPESRGWCPRACCSSDPCGTPRAGHRSKRRGRMGWRACGQPRERNSAAVLRTEGWSPPSALQHLSHGVPRAHPSASQASAMLPAVGLRCRSGHKGGGLSAESAGALTVGTLVAAGPAVRGWCPRTCWRTVP